MDKIGNVLMLTSLTVGSSASPGKSPLALSTLSLISYGLGLLEFQGFSLFITIGKYLLSFALFIFVFIRIIPRVYKISESVNSTDKFSFLHHLF